MSIHPTSLAAAILSATTVSPHMMMMKWNNPTATGVVTLRHNPRNNRRTKAKHKK